MILERLAELPVNIVAIEDPVEKHIRGISQMQVNTQAGLTFETGLRAALRQDPDVIMVGGTRDGQTLKTSVQAAGNGASGAFYASYEQRGGDCGADAGRGSASRLAASSIGRPGPEARKEDLSGLYDRKGTGRGRRELLGPGIRRIRYGDRLCPLRLYGIRGRAAVHEVLAVDKTIRTMIAGGCTREEEIASYERISLGMRTLRDDLLRLVDQGSQLRRSWSG